VMGAEEVAGQEACSRAVRKVGAAVVSEHARCEQTPAAPRVNRVLGGESIEYIESEKASGRKSRNIS
jgi:hypothetical protein